MEVSPVSTDRCRRCGGPLLANREEPSCLYCGWVRYGDVDAVVPSFRSTSIWDRKRGVYAPRRTRFAGAWGDE